MTIRPYQESDETQVVELWQSCDLVVPWNDPKQDIQRRLKVQPELFLVGAREERVAATVMADYDGHRGWIYSLAVVPELQRQGIGRQIVEEVASKWNVLVALKSTSRFVRRTPLSLVFTKI